MKIKKNFFNYLEIIIDENLNGKKPTLCSKDIVQEIFSFKNEWLHL